MNIDPNKALKALKEHNAELDKAGRPMYNLGDPEDVTTALQNIYNLSNTDADDLGMLVWELL